MAVNRSCLSAGIVVNEILRNNEDVKKITSDIFPIVKDKAVLPYVVYRRTQMSALPIKTGRSSDTAYMEVLCYAKAYGDSINLAEAVRAALHGKRYETDDGILMRSCVLTDSEEGWTGDAYMQQLIFELKI